MPYSPTPALPLTLPLTLPLALPLNAPVVPLLTNIGPRYFLIDSGCPVSFASRAQSVLAGEGGWDQEREVRLRRAPFSLHPISERLGVPLEGFIGSAELRAAGRVVFDWEGRALRLGAAPGAAPGAITLPLTPHGNFFSLRASIDGGEPLSLFIDTGSRFINLQPHHLRRDPQRALYALHVHTPSGLATHAVSAGHALALSAEVGVPLSAEGLCAATGAPPMYPPIIGAEWLSRYEACFDVGADERAPTLTLTPRAHPHTSPRPAWEEYGEDLWGPPFSVTLDPAQVEEPNRPFTLMPLPARPLPEGLLPLTPYRLLGHEVPAGPEGVNALYEALHSRGGAGEPITLLREGATKGAGAGAGAVTLTRSPLFSTPR